MADVTAPAVVSVPLNRAALCLDCEAVSALAVVGADTALHQVKACPTCASENRVPLERFFFGVEDRVVVRLDDVEHEVGNGLTPARVRAEKLIEALADFGSHPIIRRLATVHAQRIIHAIDETMRRVRALRRREGDRSDAVNHS